jgi:hypothetical protein
MGGVACSGAKEIGEILGEERFESRDAGTELQEVSVVGVGVGRCLDDIQLQHRARWRQ